MAEVAVLGAGRMGAAMARRLAKAGHTVTAWNRTPRRAWPLAGAGITVTSDAAGAVRGRDLVISMLADGAAARAVLLDSSVRSALSPGTIICDMSTSGVETARELAEAIGDTFVDAPVSGSVPAVEAGTLLVMAAGADAAIETARAILSAVADRIVVVGAPGAGQAMKLAVNLVLHDLNAALSEALVLVEGAGLERDRAYDVLGQSVVGAPYVKYKRAAFLDENAPVAMSLGLVAKDLGLICDLAAAVGSPVPVTGAVLSRVRQACAAGLDAADMAALSRFRAPQS
ncbi:NAD(P)-dependent oxidoreductase [Actinoplanes sp. NPDC051411]|uniref:NAD(P)-dependent oxidoreductase n=1 Tax=Actinoplanes sp. NPDC051411 TaxID=3155522 RepID=UPI00341A2E79